MINATSSESVAHTHPLTKNDGKGGIDPFTGERLDSNTYLVGDGNGNFCHPISLVGMGPNSHVVDMNRYPIRRGPFKTARPSFVDEELLSDAAFVHRASVIVGYAAATTAAILLLIFIAVLIFIPIPAKAESAGKITIAQAAAVAMALKNMDGHIIVVKQGLTDNMVMIPWDFGSASLRLRIASDIAILDGVARSVETSRQAIIKELLAKANERTPDKPVTEIKPGTPEYDEFQRQYADLNGSPAPGTQDLARIKASELRMDRNDIPVTVLSALGPILDDDVSAK